MPSIVERCTAIYETEGIDGANRLLTAEIPDVATRIRVMEELETTGLWGILWHYPSDGPCSDPDLGLVRDFYG